MITPKVLKDERRRRHWSQRQLAELAGISAQLVSLYERGEMRPFAAHALRLASALGLDLDELKPSDGAA